MKTSSPTNRSQPRQGFRQGFTLVEIMVALFLMGLVMVGAMTFSVHSARHVQDGTEHISFIEEARNAENRIGHIIQNARAVSIPSGDTTSLTIIQPDLTRSLMYYKEGPTERDDRLVYDPDTNVDGDEMVVCRFVSVIPSKEMFRVLPGDRNTTVISLYVGLRAPEEGARAAVRKSYTGANVYMTATPRNTVDFIQQ